MPGGSIFVYPVSGCRASNSGGLFDVGSSGYGWSNAAASASNLLGSLLYFTDSYMNPEGNNNRAAGLPVRCVKE